MSSLIWCIDFLISLTIIELDFGYCCNYCSTCIISAPQSTLLLSVPVQNNAKPRSFHHIYIDCWFFLYIFSIVYFSAELKFSRSAHRPQTIDLFYAWRLFRLLMQPEKYVSLSFAIFGYSTFRTQFTNSSSFYTTVQLAFTVFRIWSHAIHSLYLIVSWYYDCTPNWRLLRLKRFLLPVLLTRRRLPEIGIDRRKVRKVKKGMGLRSLEKTPKGTRFTSRFITKHEKRKVICLTNTLD